MTNLQIVCEAAINAELYTRDEVDEMIKNKIDIPLHTYKEWSNRGYYVRKGEKAKIVTDIWKRAKKKIYEDEMSEDEIMHLDENQSAIERDKGWFYKTKAFLFTESQVEKVSVN